MVDPLVDKPFIPKNSIPHSDPKRLKLFEKPDDKKIHFEETSQHFCLLFVCKSSYVNTYLRKSNK